MPSQSPTRAATAGLRSREVKCSGGRRRGRHVRPPPSGRRTSGRRARAVRDDRRARRAAATRADVVDADDRPRGTGRLRRSPASQGRPAPTRSPVPGGDSSTTTRPPGRAPRAPARSSRTGSPPMPMLPSASSAVCQRPSPGTVEDVAPQRRWRRARGSARRPPGTTSMPSATWPSRVERVGHPARAAADVEGRADTGRPASAGRGVGGRLHECDGQLRAGPSSQTTCTAPRAVRRRRGVTGEDHSLKDCSIAGPLRPGGSPRRGEPGRAVPGRRPASASATVSTSAELAARCATVGPPARRARSRCRAPVVAVDIGTPRASAYGARRRRRAPAPTSRRRSAGASTASWSLESRRRLAQQVAGVTCGVSMPICTTRPGPASSVGVRPAARRSRRRAAGRRPAASAAAISSPRTASARSPRGARLHRSAPTASRAGVEGVEQRGGGQVGGRVVPDRGAQPGLRPARRRAPWPRPAAGALIGQHPAEVAGRADGAAHRAGDLRAGARGARVVGHVVLD